MYIYDKVKEDFKYQKERKILKDEVQQDGKNANTSQPEIEPGTPADAAGALPTELPGPGPKPIYIYILKKKIPEGQEHAPRPEPAAPIRLAD